MAQTAVSFVVRAASPCAEADDALPRELQCEYPSKHCSNHKAFKPKGGLHKLCEAHRRKANLNQKRWQQRKREQREGSKFSTRARPNAARKAGASPVGDTDKSDPSIMSLGGSSIEPFPISDFTATPPPSSAPWRLMSSYSNAVPNYDHAAALTSGFAVGDDLDVLSMMLFNDTTSSHVAQANWGHAGSMSGAQTTSGYTLTSLSSAIV